jgi:hypothetical protein
VCPWVETCFDESEHKTRDRAEIEQLGPNDEKLRKKIIEVERLDLTVSKPRIDAWYRIIDQNLVPDDGQ